MRTGLLGTLLVTAMFLAAAPTAIASASDGGISPDSAQEARRAAYRAARAAISRGTPGAMQAAAATLRDYPLYPYLVHVDIRRRVRSVAEDEAEAFLNAWADLPIAGLFRERYLRELARRDAWQAFRRFDDGASRDADVRCHRLAAALALGENAPLDVETVDLWLHGESRPKACDPVFAHWRASGAITPALVLDRARLAVLAGQFDLAAWLARPLPAGEAAVAQTWLATGRAPERQLGRVDGWPGAARRDDFLAPMVLALARRDIGAAYAVWPGVRAHLDESVRHATERDLAVLRATDYGPDAVARLAALPRDFVDQRVLAWRVRVAIARGDWRTIRQQIEEMAPADRDDPRWQYWWARATEALGETTAAEARYAELARGAHYHGYLAADRLGQPYALCPDTAAMPAADLLARPGIVRALELHAVEQPTDARREWREATGALDAVDRLAAALLAAERGWHHQAILDLAGLNRLDRYAERFPVAWPEAVIEGAKRQSLPPSLIYAVMRSESALAPDARSGAGALGLMQLLPATARALESRAGIRVASRSRLYDPETNIRLGSAYLRKLLDELDHPLRTLAAYNAGPRPIARWDAGGRLPTEADRWIETLPYHETREYVPRVLTFQVLYEWQISGRMTRLSRMMAPLDATGAWPASWDDGTVEPVCPADRAVARQDSTDG